MIAMLLNGSLNEPRRINVRAAKCSGGPVSAKDGLQPDQQRSAKNFKRNLLSERGVLGRVGEQNLEQGLVVLEEPRSGAGFGDENRLQQKFDCYCRLTAIVFGLDGNEVLAKPARLHRLLVINEPRESSVPKAPQIRLGR